MRVLKIAGAAIGAVVVIIALLSVIGVWPSLNITLNDVTLQDPRDRDTTSRLTAGRIQADVTLASVWAGRPQITELMIVRPVLSVPLRRVRVKDASPAPKSTAGTGEAFTI